MRRHVTSIILLLVVLGALGAVWYKRLGPQHVPSSLVITNTGSQDMVFVISLPVGGVQRVPVAAGAQATCQFEAGARVDLFVGKRSDAAEGAWIIEATSGTIEILADSEGVRISGPGMQTKPISLH
ncbi:MAG: hypothetical protein NTV94_07600 [Planctomycetota bacterium]|nr:hypothetical protein [Planctomycetota bacterium]